MKAALRLLANLPLMFGIAIIGLFLFATVNADELAARDPRRELPVLFFEREGIPSYNEVRFAVPPYPPISIFPLGSDRLGRDLWSRVLYAPRITIPFMIASVCIRIIVGAALGAGIGWLGGKWRSTLGVLAGILAVVPPLVLLAVLLSLLPKLALISFPLALLLVGWVGIAEWMATRVAVLRELPYIEAARSLGQRPFRIFWNHAMPQIWPGLIVLIPLDASAVLLLMAEAGFIGYFVGGGLLEDIGTGNFVWRSDIPELGQLLAEGRDNLFHYQWILWVPALAFLIPIIGFNLLGEGMRRILDPLARRVW